MTIEPASKGAGFFVKDCKNQMELLFSLEKILLFFINCVFLRELI